MCESGICAGCRADQRRKKHGDYAGVVDIARNGIDRVNNLEKEVERLRARVAELEAAKWEPGVWLRDQRGHYEGRETLDPMFYLGARNPGRGANGSTYSPFYAAPPAPTMDVDAISDEALNAAWSYIIFNAENEQTEAVYDMRAALRAIFNKGE